MRYKVESKNSPVIVNNDEKNYIIKKTEDIVELRLDRENQSFYVRIKNPSQHTKYLYENNRLAIALCKLNTGRSQRKHMGDRPWPGDGYNTETYIKKKYHPRWSRCGLNITPVINGLDDEYEIKIVSGKIYGERYKIGIDNLRPNQYHTLGQHWGGRWFTSIKAVLLSSGSDLTQEYNQNNGYSFGVISSCRAYRTMCKRLKIRSNNNIKERISVGANHWNDYYNLSANVLQDDRNFTVTITSMGSRVKKAFDNHRLWVGLEFNDCGHFTSTGGGQRRAKYGDSSCICDYWSAHTVRKNRRFRNRASDKLICPSYNREIIESSTFTYYIEETPVEGRGSLSSLLKLARKSSHEGITVTQNPTLVIGLIEGRCTSVGNSSMILWRYDTDVECTWESYSEEE